MIIKLFNKGVVFMADQFFFRSVGTVKRYTHIVLLIIYWFSQTGIIFSNTYPNFYINNYFSPR